MMNDWWGMKFEMTVRLFFGDKAYQIAGQERTAKYRAEWLAKIGKVLLKQIDEIDTTPRHKQMLMTEAESFWKDVRLVKADPWSLVYTLVRLCGRLLGYDFVRGVKVHTPTYYQTCEQYYSTATIQGAEALQSYYDKKDTISIRRSIVEQLKEQGFSDFKIALVLNISEYEVKKLRKGISSGTAEKQA